MNNYTNDNIYIQEALIDNLENTKKEFQYEIKETDQTIKSIKKEAIVNGLILFIFPLLGNFAAATIHAILGGVEVINLLYNIGNNLPGLMVCIGMLEAVNISCVAIKKHKILKNKEAYTKTLSFIDSQIIKEKEQLSELKLDTTLSKTNTTSDNNIELLLRKSEEQVVSNQKVIANFYINFDGQKYYNYYTKGILRKKLSKRFDNSQIQAIEEELKENESIFVKKKSIF